MANIYMYGKHICIWQIYLHVCVCVCVYIYIYIYSVCVRVCLSVSNMTRLTGASQVALVVKNLNAGDARDAGSISGSGRTPEVGSDNLL